MVNINEFLTGVFYTIPEPIVILGSDSKIVMANQSFADLMGLTTDQMEGLLPEKLFNARNSRIFMNAFASRTPAEIVLRKKGVGDLTFQLNFNTGPANSGFVMVLLRDISGFRQVEASLTESESLYKTLVNQLPNPIVIHINGKVVFANDLIIEVTGLTREEIIGKNIAELMTDPNGPSAKIDFGSLMWDSFMEEEEFEIRSENRQVVIKNFLMRNSRIKYRGQDAVMTILIDITERRHLEKYILRRVIETEEKDRKQFAADLHDDLGPLLSSVRLHLGLLQNASEPEKFRKTWQICSDQLMEAITRMRVIANNLMPRLIDNFGLESALSSFIETMQSDDSFSIEFTSNLKGMRFSKFTELHFYRIICELINNTVKHAGATKAWLNLQYADKELRVSYTDNGKGYDVQEINAKGGGLGVGNIIQRANLIDARIRFTREDNQTHVQISREMPPVVA